MKIALLSPINSSLPPNAYAPVEKSVDTLANGLVLRGHDVVVFTSKDSKVKYHAFPTVDLSLEKLAGNHHEQELIHISKSCEEIIKSGFDIVNNHANAFAHLQLRNTGTRFVTTVHGINDSSRYVYSKFRKDNYTSISKAVADKCPDLNYLANIYYGIDFDKFKPADTKEDYFYTAAHICYEKGIHNAIKLAKETNTKLYISGIIQDERYFNEFIKPEINNLNIVYLGNLNREEIIQYISRAKAYVSMVEWDEPFGLSVAEAIACGTPVIATKRGSLLEMIKEGITGILVNDVDEAIKRIFEVVRIHPMWCREFGYNMFSIEKMVDGYLDVYEKMIM